MSFNVYLNGRKIDTIFYSSNATVTKEDVKRSLINHDGYDFRIVVTKAK